MKKKLFASLITSLLCGIYLPSLWAQGPGVNTLSFLPGEKGNLSRMSAVDQEKWTKAKKIYDRLIQEKGDYRFTVPKLMLRNEKSCVAEIDYKNNEIILEEKAYDVCDKLGEDFIAFLLAHELTHYFEKHAWKNEFVSHFSDMKIGNKLLSVDDQIVNETQADFLGGFLCYSAGFKVNEEVDTVLKSLYQAYQIADSMPNYPVLSERIQLTKRSIANLRSFIEVFEMANYLTMTGKYKEALAYYQYILLRYQSHKIYNNLGVVSILSAFKYFDRKKELIYEYPLELEFESIFTKDASSRDAATKRIRDSILRASIQYFDFAIGMNPNYLPAKLNKAIAWALIGDLSKASYFCEQEVMLSSDTSAYAKTQQDAWVLKGIILARKGEKENARKMFEKAGKKGSQIAKLNLDILNNKVDTSRRSESKMILDEVQIGGVSLKTFSSDPIYDDEKVIQVNGDLTFYQSQFDSLDYRIYFNMDGVSEWVNYFLVVKPNSSYKTKSKIGNGSTVQEIEAAYGFPSKRMETSQGTIWLYDQMFFNVNKEGNVSQWGSYLSKKLN
jgi:tetratricopeptide (TPR) repeat protein